MKTLSFLGFWLVASLAHSAFGAPAGALLQVAPGPSAAVAPKAIEVSASRVHLRDLGAFGDTVSDIDLGPAPALGATRTIDRDDIVRALGAANATGPTPKLAAQYRISRKSKRLEKADLEKMMRETIDPARFSKGIVFTGVRTANALVPDGYNRVTVELPTLPKKSGTVIVTVAVAFLTDADVMARITVPVELSVPPEALIPDIAKGGKITLVVRKGLVEVSLPAVAAADGDLGTILPIMLKPSGRIVRAKMIDSDHAVSIEDS